MLDDAAGGSLRKLQHQPQGRIDIQEIGIRQSSALQLLRLGERQTCRRVGRDKTPRPGADFRRSVDPEPLL